MSQRDDADGLRISLRGRDALAVASAPERPRRRHHWASGSSTRPSALPRISWQWFARQRVPALSARQHWARRDMRRVGRPVNAAQGLRRRRRPGRMVSKTSAKRPKALAPGLPCRAEGACSAHAQPLASAGGAESVGMVASSDLASGADDRSTPASEGRARTSRGTRWRPRSGT